MAKKNLTPAQILAIIQASGGDIESTGLSKKQILSAFLSSPDLIGTFQKTAGEAVEPYKQFDPTKVYNETENTNAVEDKFMQMGTKYQPFVQKYWSVIANDSSPASVTKFKQDIIDKTPDLAKKYGLEEQEISDLANLMGEDKEISAFQRAQAKREKSQYAAFNTQKVKLGVNNPETATEDYLKKTTGLAGLGSIPDDDTFVANKQKEFLKIIKDKGVTDQRALNMYGKNFNTALLAGMKKSKKSAASLSVRDLLKQNLGNL